MRFMENGKELTVDSFFPIDNGELTMDNYWGTDVPVFGIRWLKNIPISETVGNGLCAVPETPRIQPVRIKQNHPRPLALPLGELARRSRD